MHSVARLGAQHWGEALVWRGVHRLVWGVLRQVGVDPHDVAVVVSIVDGGFEIRNGSFDLRPHFQRGITLAHLLLSGKNKN